MKRGEGHFGLHANVKQTKTLIVLSLCEPIRANQNAMNFILLP